MAQRARGEVRIHQCAPGAEKGLAARAFDRCFDGANNVPSVLRSDGWAERARCEIEELYREVRGNFSVEWRAFAVRRPELFASAPEIADRALRFPFDHRARANSADPRLPSNRRRRSRLRLPYRSGRRICRNFVAPEPG